MHEAGHSELVLWTTPGVGEGGVGREVGGGLRMGKHMCTHG